MRKKKKYSVEVLKEKVKKIWEEEKGDIEVKEVAESLEVSVQTIYRVLKLNGIDIKKRSKYDELVLELWEQEGGCIGYKEIGERLNIHKETVRVILKRHGIYESKKSKLEKRDKEILEAYKGYKYRPNLKEISERLNIPYYIVYTRLRANGINLREESKKNERKIVEIWESGGKDNKTYKEIGAEVEMSGCGVRNILKRKGLYNESTRRKLHKVSPETESKVLEIWSKEGEKLSYEEIGLRVNLHYTTIIQILKRNSLYKIRKERVRRGSRDVKGAVLGMK